MSGSFGAYCDERCSGAGPVVLLKYSQSGWCSEHDRTNLPDSWTKDGVSCGTRGAVYDIRRAHFVGTQIITSGTESPLIQFMKI